MKILPTLKHLLFTLLLGVALLAMRLSSAQMTLSQTIVSADRQLIVRSDTHQFAIEVCSLNRDHCATISLQLPTEFQNKTVRIALQSQHRCAAVVTIPAACMATQE